MKKSTLVLKRFLGLSFAILLLAQSAAAKGYVVSVGNWNTPEFPKQKGNFYVLPEMCIHDQDLINVFKGPVNTRSVVRMYEHLNAITDKTPPWPANQKGIEFHARIPSLEDPLSQRLMRHRVRVTVENEVFKSLRIQAVNSKMILNGRVTIHNGSPEQFTVRLGSIESVSIGTADPKVSQQIERSARTLGQGKLAMAQLYRGTLIRILKTCLRYIP